jgi:hypothetical protein
MNACYSFRPGVSSDPVCAVPPALPFRPPQGAICH